jgi:hypothetical protein
MRYPFSLPHFALTLQSTIVNHRSGFSSINHSYVPSILFHVLLTFLSKFFSTFLRSTSSLSVFVSYLDLEEIYLPLYEEIPISATLRLREIRAFSKIVTGLSPSMADGSTSLTISLKQPTLVKRCIGNPQYSRPPFTFDLFDLRSPLLVESHLISFPPVNNMLKFTG